MFDTKIAIVLCNDLAMWQKLNVTAFLTSGIVGANPGILGEPYEDSLDIAIWLHSSGKQVFCLAITD